MLFAIGTSGCDVVEQPVGIIAQQLGGSFQQEFGMAQCALSPTGSNAYFILEPGHQLVLEGADAKLEITVLDETRVVDGITTRVVEEREWIDGQLYEVARNFFAICPATKDVFYFGEDVDFYKDGRVTGHSGTWLAGQNGAKAGLIMPGTPKVGMRYYQEIAPDVAMDRAEVITLDDTCTTPAGTFKNCLKTREGNALNIWEIEHKRYAPGIGLLQDADLLLTKYGNVLKK
jgi:hypothetical protein